MTYLTICDARKPVPLRIPSGTTISMTSMSLIYDFYNITVPQEIIRFKKSTNDDDRSLYFGDYPLGDDFSYFKTTDSFILKNKSFNDIEMLKVKEFKILKMIEGVESHVLTGAYDDVLKKLMTFRRGFLKFFKTSTRFKYQMITITGGEKIKYPTVDSGIDDYIHELVLRSNIPHVYDNSKVSVQDKIVSEEDLRVMENTKKGTIDDVLNDKIESSNRKYYFDYIQKNKKYFEPKLFFTDDKTMDNVFIFLRINNYIHSILKFIKTKEPEYYDTMKDQEVEYYDKSNIKNETLIDIIDKIYGGDKWKCFKKDFINRLERTIYTTLKTWEVVRGFYTLSSLLEYHFSDILEFDYNTYNVNIKKSKEDADEVTIVRPVGSTSYESHGELYDLLWSKESMRTFPDIIGAYKNINIHLEQVNGDESVFVDHDGNSHYNKMIGSIQINPTDGEFFGVRSDFDNERKIYFKLTSPACSITHLNFYFTDCEGRQITINSPVRLNVIIA